MTIRDVEREASARVAEFMGDGEQVTTEELVNLAESGTLTVSPLDDETLQGKFYRLLKAMPRLSDDDLIEVGRGAGIVEAAAWISRGAAGLVVRDRAARRETQGRSDGNVSSSVVKAVLIDYARQIGVGYSTLRRNMQIVEAFTLQQASHGDMFLHESYYREALQVASPNSPDFQTLLQKAIGLAFKKVLAGETYSRERFRDDVKEIRETTPDGADQDRTIERLEGSTYVGTKMSQELQQQLDRVAAERGIGNRGEALAALIHEAADKPAIVADSDPTLPADAPETAFATLTADEDMSDATRAALGEVADALAQHYTAGVVESGPVDVGFADVEPFVIVNPDFRAEHRAEVLAELAAAASAVPAQLGTDRRRLSVAPEVFDALDMTLKQFNTATGQAFTLGQMIAAMVEVFMAPLLSEE